MHLHAHNHQIVSRKLQPCGSKRPSVFVLGCGGYVPSTCVTNAQLETELATTDEWIVARTGISSRHRANSGEATSDLAYRAAIPALEQAQTRACELDLILVGTATPDTIVPSTACWLQHRLGAVKAAAMDLSAGCSGFAFGLHIAIGMIQSALSRRILVVGAEVLSRFLDYGDRQSAVLFGDGAGAAVLGPGGSLEIIHSSIGSDGSQADLIQIPAGGSRMPATPATVADRQHCVRLRGNEVFRLAVRKMCQVAKCAMIEAGLKATDIDWLVPHQANLRITEAVAEEIGIPMSRVVVDIARRGNTSAASIPIALQGLLQQHKVRLGQRIMLLAFGSGITWGCQILHVTSDSFLEASHHA